MAHSSLNLNFNLRKPNSQTPTPINLVIRYNNQKFTYPTGEHIHPRNWQGDKTKVKNYQRAKANSFNEYCELNRRLDNIENTVTNLFIKYKNDHRNEVPTIKQFKELLDSVFKKDTAPVKRLIPYIKQFIKDAATRNTLRNGNLRSKHTLKKYQTTLNHLERFVQKTSKQLDFDDITISFRDQYIDFLNKEYNLSVNSVGKDITILKTFLNNATEAGINKCMLYKSHKFSGVWEKSDSIYLNDHELQLLEDLDLTANRKLESVRDLFLIGCYTGLRFSDGSVLSAGNIQGDKLVVNTIKTGETVIIPLHPVVKRIFEKYKYNLPRSLSNQKTNDYLKEVGELIEEFHAVVQKKITKGGIKQILHLEKYKLICTHTARRSFATNLYKSGFPTIGIMKITGHRTESAFMRYIKETSEESATRLQEHWATMLQSTDKLLKAV